MEQLKTHWQTLQMLSSMSQAHLLHQLIKEAEAIVIGIGAGMSAAAGFTYVGKRFTDEFPDFIAKYRFFDMLQACLFKFEDEQEYWAFQSRFSLLNFFDQPAGQPYTDLRRIMSDKNYHIITTNADNAFYASNFDMEKVFRITGEYGVWQCADRCHQQTYQNESLIRQMVEKQSDMKIPLELVPRCPKCGAGMELNKRKRDGMVEDRHFLKQKERYEQFLEDNQAKKVLFLEIGVGNTVPQFIKHPFQQMTQANPKALFVTINHKDYFIPHPIRPQTVHIKEDIAKVLHSIALNK